MIKKTDLILLLTGLQEDGIDVDEQLRETMTSKDIPIKVIKFINDHRQMDVAKFYEKVRYNHNHKKSNLYINIVRDVDETNIQETLTTLTAFLLQVELFSKGVEDKQMFFKHTRAEEITKVLNEYYNTFDITNCVKEIAVIRVDLMAFEILAGRRSEQ